MDRISRFFIIGVPNITADDTLSFIKEYPVSGVILFKRNFQDREQLQNLIYTLKANNKGLLVAVDHEGGRVQRFKDGFTIMPSFREQVKKFTPKELYELHLKVNQELKDIGIDICAKD